MNVCQSMLLAVKAQCFGFYCFRISHGTSLSILLILAIVHLQVPASADNSIDSSTDSADDQSAGHSSVRLSDNLSADSPLLGDKRLFISGKQRLLIDNNQRVAPVSPGSLPSAEIETQIPLQPLTQKVEIRVKRTLSVDGLVLRPDGSVDVWVNGSLAGQQSNNHIRLVRATTSGPVVLNAYGKRYELYPGQRQVVSFVKKVDL